MTDSSVSGLLAWEPEDGGEWGRAILVGQPVVGAGVPAGQTGMAYWVELRIRPTNVALDTVLPMVPSKARELGEALIRLADTADRSFFVSPSSDEQNGAVDGG